MVMEAIIVIVLAGFIFLVIKGKIAKSKEKKRAEIKAKEDEKDRRYADAEDWFYKTFCKEIDNKIGIEISKLIKLNNELQTNGFFSVKSQKETIDWDQNPPIWVSEIEHIESRKYIKQDSISVEELELLKITKDNIDQIFESHLEKIKIRDFNSKKPNIISNFIKPQKSNLNINEDVKSQLKNKAVDDNQYNEFIEHFSKSVSKIDEAYELAVSKYIELQSNLEKSFDEINKNWLDKNKNWNSEKQKEIQITENLINFLVNTESVSEFTSKILASIIYPNWLSKDFEISFDQENKILIIEQEFPNIENFSFTKNIQLKTSNATKNLNQKESKEAIVNFYPLLTLRLAIDLANQLSEDLVELIVINGWVNHRNKATGKYARAFCSSLAAKVESLLEIDLEHADPTVAFSVLKGNVSKTLEIVPIAPVSRIRKTDRRFVDDREVLGKMDEGKNLASMDWEDFEHLCRELFERVFAKEGATVKVTQASRDQGVDAVIIDARPIYGGKTVIQAKRYVNTVDVSAVRDLYGTVNHEGANKGILVTTSQFGPDSYSFIQGKNLELLNGSELLYLLNENGYHFRIDLEEARKFQKDSGLHPFQRRFKE